MDLDVLEELRQLKYRHLRTLDRKQWDDFADTLTPDVSTNYGEHAKFDDHDPVVAFMRDSLARRSSPCTSAITRNCPPTATPPLVPGTSRTK